jgi:hypothetical protein
MALGAGFLILSFYLFIFLKNVFSPLQAGRFGFCLPFSHLSTTQLIDWALDLLDNYTLHQQALA